MNLENKAELKIESVPFHSTGLFPKLTTDYLEHKQDFGDFTDFPLSNKGFSERIEYLKSSFAQEKRERLAEVLCYQYAEMGLLTPELQTHINQLKEGKTFTVTTGHQLNIFGGPVYVWLKLMAAISWAKELKKQHPAANFIPVYWMATEDHDMAEISHFTLFGKKYTWPTTNNNELGSSSNTHPEGVSGLQDPSILASLQELLPKEFPSIFYQAYGTSKSLAEAVRKYIHHYFGQYGLLILDPAAPPLKAAAISIWEKDLDPNNPLQKVHQSTSASLKERGYNTQVNARECNLFYLNGLQRERIVKTESNQYQVLNTDISFSTAEIKTHLQTFPERFSPNVVIRPAYQVYTLPDVATVGGPAEIAYWLQGKDLFHQLGIKLPVIAPRLFVQFITKAQQDKVAKHNLQFLDFCGPEKALLDKVFSAAKVEVPNWKKADREFESFYNFLKQEAQKADPTLGEWIEGEKARALKQVENIYKRIEKAHDKKNEQLIQQTLNLKAKLLPNGNLPERIESFFSYQINHPSLMEELLERLDITQNQLHVVKLN